MFTLTHDKSTVGFAVDADVFTLDALPMAEVAALPTVTWEEGMWFPTGSTLGTLAAVMILQTLHDTKSRERLDVAGAVTVGGDWTLRTPTWFTHSHPGTRASLQGWGVTE
jgi:hypothetical protein